MEAHFFGPRVAKASSLFATLNTAYAADLLSRQRAEDELLQKATNH